MIRVPALTLCVCAVASAASASPMYLTCSFDQYCVPPDTCTATSRAASATLPHDPFTTPAQVPIPVSLFLDGTPTQAEMLAVPQVILRIPRADPAFDLLVMAANGLATLNEWESPVVHGPWWSGQCRLSAG